MTTIRVRYQGDLRTEATCIQSGISFLTDASIDSQGKGESFSPTDLIATAVLSSMFTNMGLTARNHGLNPGEISGEIRKTMDNDPRKVSGLDMEINMMGHYLNDSEKKLLEAAALSCPATRSIHPDIQLIVKFTYQ